MKAIRLTKQTIQKKSPGVAFKTAEASDAMGLGDTILQLLRMN